MDHQSGKIKTESHSAVFVRGLRVPPGFSPCKTHSREMAQTFRILSYTSSQTCSDCKMFDVSNWIASLNGENGPGGTTSHEALSSFTSRSTGNFPQPLDSLLPWTEAISAHLDWWQNTANLMKGSDLHPTKSVVSPGKGLHINVLELKAVSMALRHFKVQCQSHTVLVASDNSTLVAYINKGEHSTEMCALLWRIMTWCHHSHIIFKARHISGCLDMMANLLSRSNQVQWTK